MFVHSSRIKKQIEHLTQLGFDVEPIYQLAKTNADEVADPDKLYSLEQFNTVLEYAIEQASDDYYGLKMGQKPHIAGTVGMMCASCKNLKEAFVQGCKLFKIQGDFSEMKFIEDEHLPRIEYTLTNVWTIKYPKTARHEVDAMFSFLAVILKVNSNNSVKAYEINLTREAPDDNTQYEEAFGIIPKYEQEVNQMIFRQKDLMIPMKAFNPETFQLLKSHIESQLKRFTNEEPVSEKVKAILLSSMQYNFPDIETVASKLLLSPRTLQRYLQTEKTSFKSILQETRFELAKSLLKQNNLTISEIAYTLGYSDLGNFSRSFKKGVGVSPQEFRTR